MRGVEHELASSSSNSNKTKDKESPSVQSRGQKRPRVNAQGDKARQRHAFYQWAVADDNIYDDLAFRTAFDAAYRASSIMVWANGIIRDGSEREGRVAPLRVMHIQDNASYCQCFLHLPPQEAGRESILIRRLSSYRFFFLYVSSSPSLYRTEDAALYRLFPRPHELCFMAIRTRQVRRHVPQAQTACWATWLREDTTNCTFPQGPHARLSSLLQHTTTTLSRSASSSSSSFSVSLPPPSTPRVVSLSNGSSAPPAPDWRDLLEVSTSSQEDEPVPKRPRTHEDEAVSVWMLLASSEEEAEQTLMPSIQSLLGTSSDDEEKEAPSLHNLLGTDSEEDEKDEPPSLPVLYEKSAAAGTYWVLDTYPHQVAPKSCRLRLSMFTQHQEDEPVFQQLATLEPRHLQRMVLYDLMRHPFGSRSNLYLNDHQLKEWPRASAQLHAFLTLDEDGLLPHATTLHGLCVPSLVLPNTRETALCLVFRPKDDGLLLYAPQGLRFAVSLPSDPTVTAALCIRSLPQHWEYVTDPVNATHLSVSPHTLWWIDGFLYASAPDAAPTEVTLSLWSSTPSATCALFQLTSRTECPLQGGREQQVLFQPWSDFVADRPLAPATPSHVFAQRLGLSSSASSHPHPLAVSAGVHDFRRLEEQLSPSSTATTSVTSSSDAPSMPLSSDIEHILSVTTQMGIVTVQFQSPEYEHEYGPLYRFLSTDGHWATLLLQGLQPAPGIFQLDLHVLAGGRTNNLLLGYQPSPESQSMADKVQEDLRRYHTLWRRVCKMGVTAPQTPKNLLLEVMKLAQQLHPSMVQLWGTLMPEQSFPLPHATKASKPFVFMLRRSQQQILSSSSLLPPPPPQEQESPLLTSSISSVDLAPG